MLFSFIFLFFFLFGFLHSMASYRIVRSSKITNSTTQIHMQIMFSRLVVSPRSVSPTLSSSSANISYKIFVIYLLITLTSVQCDAYCDANHYYSALGKCMPCSACDASQSIVLRPCQAHLDTVCGTLEDLELELNWLKSAVAVQNNRVSYPKMFKVLRCWQKVPVP